MDDRLDRSTVKNLIGRSQSIKVAPRTEGGGGGTDVRRAISFRQRGDAPLSPVSLQKAAEFKQQSVEEPGPQPAEQPGRMRSPVPAADTLSEEDEEGDAPQLPHAPPPTSSAEPEETPQRERSVSPSYGKKGGLSPPMSPSQKRLEHVGVICL